MLDVSDVADWKTCILGYNVTEGIYMVGNGFYGAEGMVKGIIVLGAASLPIFLIY